MLTLGIEAHFKVLPELHTESVDVLKADVCQPGDVGAEIVQVQLEVDVLVLTVAEDDMTYLLGHGPTGGGEGIKERVEHRTESLRSEGAGQIIMGIYRHDVPPVTWVWITADTSQFPQIRVREDDAGPSSPCPTANSQSITEIEEPEEVQELHFVMIFRSHSQHVASIHIQDVK